MAHVNKYGHSSGDDSGKAHPSGVAKGLPMVEGSASGPGKHKDFEVSPRQVTPKSARGGDGTANLRGTKPKTMQKPKQGPTSTSKHMTMSGVKRATGVSVPKKIK